MLPNKPAQARVHLVFRLPPKHVSRSRCTYVLDWMCSHPYAGGVLSWAGGCDTVPAAFDLAELTARSVVLQTTDAVDPPAAVRIGQHYTTVPVIGDAAGDAQLFEHGRWTADWMSSLFYWLSRYEEQRLQANDPPEAATQWLVRNGAERTPAADRLLVEVLLSLSELLDATSAPILRQQVLAKADEPSSVHLSHDLDHVRLFQRPDLAVRHAASVAKKGQLVGAGRVMSDYARVSLGQLADPYDNANSTLCGDGGTLFLLLGRHVAQDGGRDKTDERLKTWINLARKRGYKLGLHPSYTTPEHSERITAEVDRFELLTGERPVVSRQHFLRWNWATSPKLLEGIGVKGDSTLGYRDRLGFRCGTSFPYRLYDFASEASAALYEWPLAGMDGAWMRSNDYDPLKCASDWSAFVTENSKGAAIMLNVHNSQLYYAELLGIDLAAWYRFAHQQATASWTDYASL